MDSAHTPPLDASVLIIGTGFGGLGMAINLKRAGIGPLLLLEKAADVGGCWRDNTYPGAACDVPSHLYSFSFEPKADWSRKFAPQPEIFAYLQHCARKYNILPHVRFNTEVAAASYDEAARQWQVETTDGRVFRARYLITACGQLSRPAYPRLPGVEQFAGTRFHSARWDHGYDLAGKTVAVVGTGASAIQFVPEIARKVRQLYLFQRTPPYVIPKPDRAYRAAEIGLLRRFPLLQTASRAGIYLQHEARAIAFAKITRAMELFELQFHRHLRKQIKDPELRARLTPDYPMGCKRILISNNYYEALNRPNVELVTDDIDHVEAQAVITRDGSRRRVDAIIYGTGFQATEFLAPMRVTGRGGRDLNGAWRDGAEAYLGITVPGFPNLFLLYGPNTNLGHNSIVYMLESQFAHVLQCIRHVEAHGLRAIDVRPEINRRYNDGIQRQVKHTVWNKGCSSWYIDANGRHTVNWPTFTLSYRQLTRHLDTADYHFEKEE